MSWGSTKAVHISFDDVDGDIVNYDDSFSSYGNSAKAYRDFQPVANSFTLSSPKTSGYVIIFDEIYLTIEEDVAVGETNTPTEIFEFLAPVFIEEDFYIIESDSVLSQSTVGDNVIQFEEDLVFDDNGRKYEYDLFPQETISFSESVFDEDEDHSNVPAESLAISESLFINQEDALTVFYLDPINGNDSNDGLTFGTRVQTFTTGLTSAKINAQAPPYIVRSNTKS